jgi:TolB protein
LRTPNQTYLSGISTDGIGLSMAPVSFQGDISGMTWRDVVLPWPLPDSMATAADHIPAPLWEPRVTTTEDIPTGRFAAVELPDVDAPYALMSDRVDEAYIALREKVSAVVGWDLLSSLDNAYVPFTTPLSPGMAKDWLYTGRAFALNPLLVNTGWMVMVREDFGPETYWRIYLRSRIQDGSIGQPLHELPWDMDARFSGDPTAYEQGGALFENMPTGYWIDFTILAIQYGWERLPALPSWIHFYPGSQFNKFVHTNGLDWDAAMLELYPPEILITPTPIPTPTETPSAGLIPSSDSYAA